MKLENENRPKYFPEIRDLYRKELGGDSASGLIYFGIFKEDGSLMAISSIKNYMGSWYLRGCVVKPEYRGQGLQKQLIKERLEYLKGKTDTVRVSVYPENMYSIANIESTGFIFERKKKLDSGKLVLVYKINL